MDEKEIFEALGVAPEEPAGEGGNEQGNARPAAQAAEEGKETPDRPPAAAKALKAPQSGASRPQSEGGENAPPASVQAEGAQKGAAAEDAPGEPEDAGGESQGQSREAAPKAAEGGLTEEERRENAAQRRRQEQQAAIDRAVEEALRKEREKAQGEWSDFFNAAKLKNTMTGEPIRTLEEFQAWNQAFQTAQIAKDLEAGKLTREALDKAVADNPSVKRAEEIIRRDEEARRQAEEAAAKARIDGEIAEIHKMDPAVSSVEDLMKMPNAKQFYEYVKRGNSFLDAYYLANREALEQRAAQAARQQAMSAARSKDHLTATGNARGAGAASVPSEEMQLFRLLNPDATEAEIQKYYNRKG